MTSLARGHLNAAAPQMVNETYLDTFRNTGHYQSIHRRVCFFKGTLTIQSFIRVLSNAFFTASSLSFDSLYFLNRHITIRRSSADPTISTCEADAQYQSARSYCPATPSCSQHDCRANRRISGKDSAYNCKPALNGGYNPDPNAYSLYTLYTAAHEGTFFDQSEYINISPAAPAGSHIDLALSLSKHSTYTFNPDFYPITPAWFIDADFASITILYKKGELSDLEYYYAIFLGEDAFYGCLVERFSDQGVIEANQRVNVGEPAHPINGSAFIQDDSSRALKLTDKLTNPLF